VLAKVRYASAKLRPTHRLGDPGDASDPTLDHKPIIMVPRPPAIAGDEQSQAERLHNAGTRDD
jgi:hypothetical protein